MPATKTKLRGVVFQPWQIRALPNGMNQFRVPCKKPYYLPSRKNFQKMYDARIADLISKAPYQPGEVLFVKETFKIGWTFQHGHGLFYQAEVPADGGHPRGGGRPFHCWNGCCNDLECRQGYDWLAKHYGGDFRRERWRSATRLPEWASRFRIKITSVGVGRRQEIVGNDVAAMGFPFSSDLDLFKQLWDAQHAKSGNGFDVPGFDWAFGFDLTD